MSRLETPSLRKPGLDIRRSGHERGTGPPGPALETQETVPHTRAARVPSHGLGSRPLLGGTGARWHLDGSTVGVVIEPCSDNGRPELGLWPEAERLVKTLSIVSLKPDVLARHLLAQTAHHRRGDALPPVRGRGPHVEQVGVADSVGKQTRHADYPISLAGDSDVLRLMKRPAQRLWRPPVVEVVSCKVGFDLCPVDVVQRVVDADLHGRSIASKRPVLTRTLGGHC